MDGLDTFAVILAGGSGSRFGGGQPKQLIRLAGHPILHHTLRRFDDPELTKGIVVPANPLWRSEIEDIVDSAVRRVPATVVDGGSDRNESIRNSIATLVDDEAKVLVHDGVRPLVSRSLIRRVVAELDHVRSVLPVIESADPLATLDGSRVAFFSDRKQTFRGQSPQGFRLSDLRTTFAPENDALTGGMTTVFEAMRAVIDDIETGVVEGDVNNLKITLPADHMIAGRLLLDDDYNED